MRRRLSGADQDRSQGDASLRVEVTIATILSRLTS